MPLIVTMLAPTPSPIIIPTPVPITAQSTSKDLASDLIKLILEILNYERESTVS